MSHPGLRELRTERIDGSERAESDATVVIEEPLEIRLDGEPIAVIMRTPGSDVELALGFLYSEGILADAGDLASAAHCPDSANAIDVTSAPGARVQRPDARAFFASSGCGICGKASIESVRVRAAHLGSDTTSVSARVLRALPDALRREQTLFAASGALHAAGLFRPDGTLVCAREDVGRHNAVDKVIGWALLRERLPLHGHVLLLSGRCGFELAQKALVAQIPIVASISGPSSLAVELARESGLTLAAFVRGERMNLCSEPGRIVLP